MNFQPLSDFVLIKRIDPGAKSSGGIIIPDSAREKPSEGLIVSVGPGEIEGALTTPKPMSVKVGDRVLFAKWSGHDVQFNNEEFTLIRQKEIYGVFTAEQQ